MYGLDVTSLLPGKYRVVCCVKGLVSGNTVVKSRTLTLVEIK